MGRRAVGTLRTDGPRAYMDGERVDRRMRLPNGAFLETGASTGMRVDFHGSYRSNCRIDITDFRRGHMYGETEACVHAVETHHTGGVTDRARTIYHVKVAPNRTVLTVLHGQLKVYPAFARGRALAIGALQEIVVTPNRVRGPYAVSRADWTRRVDWRQHYNFQAVSQGACKDYASHAVSQARRNQEMRCGYRGTRWSTRARTHFDACVAANDPAYIEEQTATRDQDLEHCNRTANTAAKSCRGYAETAVEQNQQNTRRRCGLTGRRWQSNYQTHYAWCAEGDNYRIAHRETAARERALDKCGGSRNEIAKTCRAYAKTAVQQNRENIQRKCRYQGVRWLSDYDAHYGWCTDGGNHSRAAGETSTRAAMLQRCRRVNRDGVQIRTPTPTPPVIY